MNRVDIFNELQSFFTERLNVNPEEIKESVEIESLITIDSLNTLLIMFFLEKKFKVSIEKENQNFLKKKSIDDLINLIEDKKSI